MEIVIKKLDELRHIPRDREDSEAEISEYICAIESFGQLRPIVIDEDNIILTGERIYSALLRLKRTTAACKIVAGLTKPEKQRLIRIDEEIFNLTEDDLLCDPTDEIICPHCGFKFERGNSNAEKSKTPLPISRVPAPN